MSTIIILLSHPTLNKPVLVPSYDGTYVRTILCFSNYDIENTFHIITLVVDAKILGSINSSIICWSNKELSSMHVME